MESYKSKVYTERPPYADFDSPAKFQAIQSIIARRLTEHPSAICSYSGGSDSDIMIDIIERTRKLFNLPSIKYVFFNTGLEMKAIKDHVKETADKYGVEIEECRPKVNIVTASRTYGIPFVSKIMSAGLSEWQKKEVPLSIAEEYEQAEDKGAKRRELKERYPKCESLINFLCCCNSAGEPRPDIQLVINSSKYMRDFIDEYPPDFQISAKCCDYCKKQLAHSVQKGYEMIITGERRDEGGMRSVPRKDNTALCFGQQNNGQYRLRPLYYVSDKDKQWYKERYKIRYSDAYEVYGLTRTGCCGCPISYKAVDDLEKIRPYEPNVVIAAWNIFGKSYEYRAKYNQYKASRMEAERKSRIKKEGAGMAKDTVEKIPKSDTSVITVDTKSINKHLKALDNIFDAFRKNYFFAIGFGLHWFDDTGAFQQIGNKTYSTIADFAKDRYGISKATTYQYLAVIKKFGQINPDTGEIDAIQDKYKEYKSTALIIMAGMTDEQLAQCSPDMKTKELKAIRDGLLLEDMVNGDKKQSEKPKSPSLQNKSNIQPLFKIESVSDLESRSKEILESIKKVLMQDNGKKYHVDISMTWD